MSQRHTKRLSLCLSPLSPFSIFPLPGQCSLLSVPIFFPNSCVPNIPPPTLRILPHLATGFVSLSFTFLFFWSLSILLSLLYFSLFLFHLLSLQFFLPSTVFFCTPLILLPPLFKETRLHVCSLSPNTTVVLLLFVYKLALHSGKSPATLEQLLKSYPLGFGMVWYHSVLNKMKNHYVTSYMTMTWNFIDWLWLKTKKHLEKKKKNIKKSNSKKNIQ